MYQGQARGLTRGFNVTTLFEPRLVLANFDEVFAYDTRPESRPIVLGRGVWQKAVLLPNQTGYVLVAPSVPSNLTPEAEAWSAPRRVIIPSLESGQLCRDLLNDEKAWASLIAEVTGKGPVQVWAQVFSPGVAAIVEALVAASIEVDTTELPRVSGQTVAFWNTKIGGREFLQSIPVVREALPAAIICNTLVEVIALVATTNMDQGLVVKTNSSTGGAGVWVFPPDTPCQMDEITHSLSSPRWGGKNGSKQKRPDEVVGPYLVEEMVGVPSVNSSPTADFRIWANGHADLVGIGEQLLEEGVAYRGCRYPVRGDNSQIESCITLGRKICAALHRRGYRGFVNVDFMLLENGDVRIAEMNLRQSAPLDQFLVMRRRFGSGWERRKAYLCEEGMALSAPVETTSALYRILERQLHLAKGEMVCPLAIYEDSLAPGRRVSLLSVADSLSAAEKLTALARALVGGSSNERRDA